MFLTLPMRRAGSRARVLYEITGHANLFAEQSLYLNLGYWKDEPDSLDDACQAMARLLGDTAEVTADDTVLDVGFGFGEQDIYWMRRHRPRALVGLNIIPGQAQFARRRAERDAISGLEFVIGTATALPFPEAVFSKVLALESAHHFATRDDFFREAFRVLEPGGRFAAAEVLELEGGGTAWHDQAAKWERHFFAAWPRGNWYTEAVYRQKLERQGFTHVRVQSIRQYVYPQLIQYLTFRLEDPELKVRVNPLHRRRWLKNVRSVSYRGATLRNFDYVIVSADKP